MIEIATRSLWIVCVATALSSVGCSAEARVDSDTEEAELGQPLLLDPLLNAVSQLGSSVQMTTALISTNALPPGALVSSVNLVALQVLANGPLTGKDDELTPTPLLATFEGREVLKYVARCALSLGSQLTSGANVFEGRLGYAPGWVAEKLTTAEQEQMTACLLAHANDFNFEVRIGVQYPSAPAVPDHALPKYLVQEAAFYGNILALGQPAQMFACIGWTGQNCIQPLFEEDLRKRVCGNTPACGFQIAGACHDRFGVLDACSSYPGEYAACGPMAAPRGSNPPTPYKRVATVSLRSKAALQRLHREACTAASVP
jgi:hypothetical protein